LRHRIICSSYGFWEQGDDPAARNRGLIDAERLDGFHVHFSSGNSLLFFGGGFKRGFAYGKTADAHPMLPIENPVRLEDVHATIYKSLGIPASTSYTVEDRSFSVTKDG
jgi:Protein of unknown function (DUF1501)